MYDHPRMAICVARIAAPWGNISRTALDILVGLGTHEIANLQDFQNALMSHAAGDRVEVRFRRGDQTLSVMVTLGDEGLAANHLPFEYDPHPAPWGTLRAHVARANAVWREARADLPVHLAERHRSARGGACADADQPISVVGAPRRSAPEETVRSDI